MIIREPKKEDLQTEKKHRKIIKEIKNNNLCPTCEHSKKKNIFFDDDREIIFEDKLFLVRFEHNPRREGHSILIFKEHFEDISDMPIDLAHKLMAISKSLIDSLKNVLQPVKVYMVTMCDGGRNHLHFQYIPRYKNQLHGKHVFVSDRKVFNYNKNTVNRIKKRFRENLIKYNY